MHTKTKIIISCFFLGALLAASFFVFKQEAIVATEYKFSIQSNTGLEIFKITDLGNLTNFGAEYDLDSSSLPTNKKPGGWETGFELRDTNGQIIFYVEENGNVHAAGIIHQDAFDIGSIFFPGFNNVIIANNSDEIVAYISNEGHIYLAGHVVAEGKTVVYVFATQGLREGNFGGLAAADNFCAQQAAAAGLSQPLTYKAWLSDNITHAKNRLNHMEGWQFVTPNSGNKLVSNGLPLDGYLFNPIDRDQFGNPILGDQFVFTGTDEFGNKIVNLTCDNWTETYGHNPRSGRLDLTNENWTNYISDACNTDHRLYCFKQGAIVIPSPSF